MRVALLIHFSAHRLIPPVIHSLPLSPSLQAFSLQQQQSASSSPTLFLVCEAQIIARAYAHKMNGSINSYQATLALEHTFVDSSASGWWEEEAKEVLEFSSDLDLIIRTVKFIPLSDPTIAKALLSKRDETRLQGLAKSLFPGEATIDRKLSSSSIPKWNGDWLISTLVKSNIRTTAEILDCQIQWEFCKIKFSEWTAWICGIKSDNISNLLAALFDFRGTLAEHARAREDFLERLVLLEKASCCAWPELYLGNDANIL